MKTFKTLTIDDKIYSCKEGSMDYSEHNVSAITPSHVQYGSHGDKIPMVEKTSQRAKGRYETRIFFVSEGSARRYAKAQVIKELEGHFMDVRKALQRLSEFRQKNWDRLNHDYTDRVIRNLERKANQ